MGGCEYINEARDAFRHVRMQVNTGCVRSRMTMQMTYRDTLDPDVWVERETVGGCVVSRQPSPEAKDRNALLEVIARDHSAQRLDGIQVLVGLSHVSRTRTGYCGK